MSKTIIPSSNPKNPKQNPGKNNVFVGSRLGGPSEQSRTKQQSIKHQNPEFFKRQSDRKHMDNGIPARKDVPIQRDFNHHQKNVGKDIGRGVGCVGKDQAPFQMKQFSKGTQY